MHGSGISVILFVVIIAFSLYRRFSRTIQWAPLQSNRFVTRAVVWSLLLLVPFLEYKAIPMTAYFYYAGGLVLGVALGFVAIRMARFESRNGQWHYRMNRWIGGLVILIFLLRILTNYLGMAKGLAQVGGTGTSSYSVYASDPYSLGLFTLVFSYYASTGWLLIKKTKVMPAGSDQVEPSP